MLLLNLQLLVFLLGLEEEHDFLPLPYDFGKDFDSSLSSDDS